MIAAHGKSPVTEFVPYPPGSVEGKLQVDLIDRRHEGKIALADPHGLVVEAGTGEGEKTSLIGHGQRVSPVRHRFTLVPLMRPSAPDKKSFSMVSSPILA